MLATVAQADNSDYIWNQTFEKKFALAQKGDVKAQYDVGNMYLKGQGTARNAKEAFEWFSKAAEQGYSRAEYKLGYLYQTGTGVDKSLDKAYSWLKKSAQKDYTPAMFYLGNFYASRADYDSALTWYTRADEKGYHPAQAEIPKMKAQIAKARAESAQAAAAAQVAAAPKAATAKSADKPVAKKTITPAPEPESTVQLDKKARYTKAVVSTGNWRRAGKPAGVLPSDISVCKPRGNSIICASDEQKVEEKYGTVSYKESAELQDFNSEGEFNVEYQRNVTLIFPSEPDNPKLVIPIEYGLQKKELMRCKLDNNEIVCYRGQNREKLIYSKT